MATDAVVNQSLADMLSAYTAALVTPKIGLFKNGVSPSPNSHLADLIEPTGSWYAQVAAVFGQVFLNADGSVEQRTQAAQFNYTGADAAELISGWFIAAGATPVLVCARALAVPVSMANLLSSVIVDPGVRIPSIPAAA